MLYRIKQFLFLVLAINNPLFSCNKDHFDFAERQFQLLESPINGGLNENEISTWGGSVIKGDDGLYHMFVSGFSNNCGLSSWQYNSEILRATSSHPLGPFEIQEKVIDAMAHNPTIRKTPDGKYVLFYIGEPKSIGLQIYEYSQGITITNNNSGLTPWTCLLNVTSAPSPTGPWTPPKRVVDLLWLPICASNPAPIINDDNSIEYYYRAYQITNVVKEYLYKGKANKWDGNYQPSNLNPILNIEAEDPFVWKDETGYYMVYNNKFVDDFNTGGLAYSENGNHFVQRTPLYSREIKFDNGQTIVVYKRERPQILWLEDGRGVLYTAIQEDVENDKIYTLATPIGNWTEDQLTIE